MHPLRFLAAAATLALAAASFAASAEATGRRCGYDRYGYRPPDFSGCPRYYRDDWDYVPVRRAYRAPVYDRFYYVPAPRCWYDRGWYRVVVVCE